MADESLLPVVVKAVIVSVIGALASLLVERAWRRRKAKQQRERDSQS